MAGSRSTAFRVPGHGLLNQGARLFNKDGRRVRAHDDPSCRGKCSCGLPSPEAWLTKRELRNWHTTHKTEVTNRVPFTAAVQFVRNGTTLEVPGPGIVTWTGDRMVFTPEEDL